MVGFWPTTEEERVQKIHALLAEARECARTCHVSLALKILENVRVIERMPLSKPWLYSQPIEESEEEIEEPEEEIEEPIVEEAGVDLSEKDEKSLEATTL